MHGLNHALMLKSQKGFDMTKKPKAGDLIFTYTKCVPMTQCKELGKLLKRKNGVTALEIILQVGTVCPHKRMSDLKDAGWTIVKEKVPGKTYHRYFGSAPFWW